MYIAYIGSKDKDGNSFFVFLLMGTLSIFKRLCIYVCMYLFIYF